jgi:hypothetical protein
MLTNTLVAAWIRSNGYSFMLTIKKITMSYLTIYVTFLMVSAIWRMDYGFRPTEPFSLQKDVSVMPASPF